MKKLICIFLFNIIMIFIFFKHLFYDDTIILMLLGAVLCILAMKVLYKNKIYFSLYHILWSTIILIMGFGIFINEHINDAIKFTLVFSMISMLGFILSWVDENWEELFLKLLVLYGTVNEIFTFLQVLFPEKILSICQLLLKTEEEFNYTYRWIYEDSKYAGISGQLGTNAFFMSLLVIIWAAKFMNSTEKNKMKNAIYFILANIALILTGKKGLILASLLSIDITYFFYVARKKEKIIWVNLHILCISFFAILLLLRPSLSSFLKNNFFLSTLTRQRLYDKLWENIKVSFLTGRGTSSTGWVLDGHLGHNIYLQSLHEQGIVGLIALISALVIPIIFTFREYIFKRRNLNIKENTFILCSLMFQIFFLIYGLSGNPLYDYNIFLVYMIWGAGYTKLLHIQRKDICKAMYEDTIC